jgi:hypothetical protein
MSAVDGGCKPLPANTSADSLSAGDRALTKPTPETDPDLARVAAAWPGLAGPIKAAILALVGSAAASSAG